MPGWENKAVVWWPGSLYVGCGEGRNDDANKAWFVKGSWEDD